MDAQKLIVYDGREGEVVEQLHHEVIDFLVVFSEAFCSEVEEGGELPAFVVAPEEVDCVFEPNLEGEDECQYFDGEAASIDVVSEEEVLGGF